MAATLQQPMSVAFGGVAPSSGLLRSPMAVVRDVVVDGPRLENLSWRLWHRARVTPRGCPTCDVRPRLLSSPSLSAFSDRTAASSNWDRDTAVGDNDDDAALPSVHTLARRIPPVSPLPATLQLNWARKRPSSPAPASASAHGPGPIPRLFPTPHHQHPRQADTDAECGAAALTSAPTHQHPHADAHDEPKAPVDKSQCAALTPTIVEPQHVPTQMHIPPTTSTSLPAPTPTPSPSSSSALTSATFTPRQSFPTVVVVNPMPLPTPPATPSPSQGLSLSQGKERDQSERREDVGKAAAAATVAMSPPRVLPAVRFLQHVSSHSSHPHLPIHQAPTLRQLPTNPPARCPAPIPAPDPHPRKHLAAPAPNPRQLPNPPQLVHLGLGHHLPAVPPKQRCPIEITETSSNYETTDTEGDKSSWESDVSGDEGNADSCAQMASSKAARSTGGTLAKNGKVAAACTSTNNNPRTRDPGEFARDAALEVQRPRDIIQKLPPTSYSNLAQFPRTKSGLSFLFHPDSMLFSEGHLYRTMRSSQDILARNWSAPVPPPAMAAVSKRAAAVSPAVNAEPVSSMKSKTGVVPDVRRQSNTSSQQQRGGYRPRIKPEDVEIEMDFGDEYLEDMI
ncbi:hypothetical protein K439DRAFT_1531048 [Ramaria rubella]|nr:hypothetical protein K439DRAFT_1531048 [Ramaria rubella]